MARFRVVLRFEPDDDAFRGLDGAALHDAICRAYPYLRYSELVIEQFEPLDDDVDAAIDPR